MTMCQKVVSYISGLYERFLQMLQFQQEVLKIEQLHHNDIIVQIRTTHLLSFAVSALQVLPFSCQNSTKHVHN